MILTLPQEKAVIAISKIQLSKSKKEILDNFISIVENEGINSGSALFFIKTIEENRSQVVNPDMHILALKNSVEEKITGVGVGMSQIYFMIMVAKLGNSSPEIALNEANNYFGVDLTIKTRKPQYVIARQMLIKKLTQMGVSVTEISRLIKKDHSTIIFSLKAINERIKNNKDVRDKWLHFVSI